MDFFEIPIDDGSVDEWFAVILYGKPMAFCLFEEDAKRILEQYGAEKIVPVQSVRLASAMNQAIQESEG